MINRIYSTVKFISNNQMQGNVSPTEFNISLYNAILERYESYFFELNKVVNEENRGRITGSYGNIPQKLEEKIGHFLEKEELTVTTTTVGLPTSLVYLPDNHRYTDLLVNNTNNKPFELAKNMAQFDTIDRLKHIKPTASTPLAIKTSEGYKVLPNDLEGVSMYYLRTPKKPNWTYVVPPGSTVELFNPSDPAFVDVDMHISEESKLTLMVLERFGINLKEADLANYANREEMQEYQKESDI